MPFFFLLARKKKSWDHISDINSHQRLREEKSVQCKQNEITLVAFIHFRMVASPTSQVENLPKTKALDVHLWAGLDPPRLAERGQEPTQPSCQPRDQLGPRAE